MQAQVGAGAVLLLCQEATTGRTVRAGEERKLWTERASVHRAQASIAEDGAVPCGTCPRLGGRIAEALRGHCGGIAGAPRGDVEARLTGVTRHAARLV